MNSQNIKIILSGLDNAGKTSMLVGLRRMYGFEDEVKALKPTIRVDYYRRQFLDLQLNFFDMGGQSKFRTSYLKRPIYFEAVNQLIFLIDIQDELRFDESVAYLGNILEILDKNDYDKNNPIYICFSKADYEFVTAHMVEYLTHIKMIKDLIKKYYSQFKFEYYSTSIYNLYTIVRMISSGLQRHLVDYEAIHQSFNEFGESNDLKQILLFDHTGLVISDFFRGDGEGLEMQNKIDQIISSHLNFFGQLEDNDLEITSTRGVDGDFMNLCYQFHLFKDLHEETKDPLIVIEGRKNEDPIYYNYYLSMVVSLDKSVDIESKIPEFITKIRNNLRAMLSSES